LPKINANVRTAEPRGTINAWILTFIRNKT
jgi:hypothetical protein